MPAPSGHSIAIACGAAGAYVDISAYVLSSEGVDRDWGKSSDFEDTHPGRFSFTLNNADGRFTPGNTAGGLSTPLVEGMGVCWQVGTRLMSGTIRTFGLGFPSMIASLSQIRVTCDDMLGSAARRDLPANISEAAILGSSAYLYWPLTDAAGVYAAGGGVEVAAVESSGNGATTLGSQVNITGLGASVTTGVAGPPYGGATQFELTSVVTLGSGQDFLKAPNPNIGGSFPTITYPSTASLGSWGFWSTLVTASPGFEFDVFIAGGYQFTIFVDEPTLRYAVRAGGAGVTNVGTTAVRLGDPHYIGMTITQSGTTQTASLYVDGVLQSTSALASGVSLSNAQKQVTTVQFETGVASLGVGTPADGTKTYRVSQLSHTPVPVVASDAGTGATESARLVLLAQTAKEVTLTTPPAALSSAQLARNGSTGSLLDAFNDVIRTEQGYIYTRTTGSLLSPTQQLVVRERTRPPSGTLAATFDILTDVVDSPELIRSLTDTLSSVTVAGPDASASVSDTTLVPLVGSATRTEDVLLELLADLTLWGQDRLARAKFTTPGLRVASFVVDAYTTDVDRWALLASLLPGDRIRLTSLPLTQLGFSSWDGWLIGGNEHHTEDVHQFTFYVALALPDTAIYDTNRYMAGTSLNLSSTITSGALTMSIATTGPKFTTSAGDLPLTVVLDSEHIVITACTSATPQVATITRAADGTTAAAHTAGAQIELATSSLYAF